MDFFYLEHLRLDWGFGNPNKTAALIVCLMMLSWLPAFWFKSSDRPRLRRVAFWVSLITCAVFGYFLLQTYSRGGFVAALGGGFLLLITAPRPWPWRRVWAITFGIGFLLLAGIHNESLFRATEGVMTTDVSVNNRLLIWKEVPHMMFDAPQGWGVGQSGNAFMQWYQPKGNTESYRTLVNSHFTWWVEFDWPRRIGYTFAWLLALALCLPHAKARWYAVVMAAIFSFAITALFSSVAEEPALWIAPLAGLGLVLLHRVARWVPISGPGVGAAVLFTTAIMGILAIIGLTDETRTIQLKKNLITVGEGEPTFRLVSAVHQGESEVLPKHFGHQARGQSNTTFEVMWPFASATQRIDRVELPLVYAGTVPTQCDTQQVAVILLNPQADPPENWPEQVPTTVVRGSFYKSGRSAWRDFVDASDARRLVTIPGAGTLLPNWLELIEAEVKMIDVKPVQP